MESTGAPLGPPPEDPEEWSDEQWIAWLKATDASGPEESPPVTSSARIARSTGGRLLGQTMIGLERAIFGERDEPAVHAEAPSDPVDDREITVHLDPEHPERSYARRREAQSPGA